MSLRIKVALISGAVFGLIALGLWASEVPSFKFSHKQHIDDAGVDCAACHQVTGSQAATDNLLPKTDACSECHEMAEIGYSDSVRTARHLQNFGGRFAHARHVKKDDDEAACLKCHTGIEAATNNLTSHLPAREYCQTCHSGADALTNKSDCGICHAGDFKLKPINHALNWRTTHGVTTDRSGKDCSHCHQQSSCIECHTGDNLNRKPHPLNFVDTHGMKAKGNKENCQTCHADQTFCMDCHTAEMVMPKNHSYAGWSNKTTGGNHARMAKADLENCMLCHGESESEPVCSTCHE